MLWRPWELDKLKRLLRTRDAFADVVEHFPDRSPAAVRNLAGRVFPALYLRFRKRSNGGNTRWPEDKRAALKAMLAQRPRPAYGAIARALKISRGAVAGAVYRYRRGTGGWDAQG